MPPDASLREDRLIKGRFRNAAPQKLSRPRFRLRVLCAQIDALNRHEARDRVLAWARRHESRYVVFANAHVVVEAAADPGYGWVVNGADMAMPDGAPVAWMMRRLGRIAQERVCGPDLMWALLERCATEGLAVYFYGGAAGTLQRLVERVTAAFPALRVVGHESPPFRPLTAEEDEDAVRRIGSSGADLVFVGLGCPKQERWMAEHRGRLDAVMLGVGAAFDFHAGTVSRAPAWMRRRGFEWLHRLASEPRRLWRRYLLTNTAFIFGAARQLLSLRLFGK